MAAGDPSVENRIWHASEPAEFDRRLPHVESLELYNTPWTTGAENFIGRFKQLKKLKIANAAMTELPKELTEMQNLAHLALQGNRIRLTPASVEQLGRLKKLEVLELAGNP